jgi:hypothetical protein
VRLGARRMCWCTSGMHTHTLKEGIRRSGIGEINCVCTSRSVGSQLGQARGNIPERRGVKSEEERRKMRYCS